MSILAGLLLVVVVLEVDGVWRLLEFLTRSL